MDQQTNVSPITSTPPTSTPTSVRYAGFWLRFGASFIDSLITAIGINILMFVVATVLKTISIGYVAGIVGVFSSIISFVLTFLYYCLLTHYKGATYGKMFMGIEVRSVDNQRLSLSKVIIRETIGKIVSGIILGIGYIMVAFTEKKQGLHDLMAGSVVVYKDPTKELSVIKKVVIGISILFSLLAPIGILVGVVLISMNTAGTRSEDAKIRSQLSMIRANMEVYQSQNNSYSNATDCDSGAFASDEIKSIINTLPKENLSCKAFDTSYAVSVKLNEKKMETFCVDSVGYSGKGRAIDDGTKAMCERPNIM